MDDVDSLDSKVEVRYKWTDSAQIRRKDVRKRMRTRMSKEIRSGCDCWLLY